MQRLANGEAQADVARSFNVSQATMISSSVLARSLTILTPAFFLGPQMAQVRLMAYHHLAKVAPERTHDVAPTLPEERYGLKRADKRRSPEMATSRGSSIAQWQRLKKPRATV